MITRLSHLAAEWELDVDLGRGGDKETSRNSRGVLRPSSKAARLLRTSGLDSSKHLQAVFFSLPRKDNSAAAENTPMPFARCIDSPNVV